MEYSRPLSTCQPTYFLKRRKQCQIFSQGRSISFRQRFISLSVNSLILIGHELTKLNGQGQLAYYHLVSSSFYKLRISYSVGVEKSKSARQNLLSQSHIRIKAFLFTDLRKSLMFEYWPSFLFEIPDVRSDQIRFSEPMLPSESLVGQEQEESKKRVPLVIILGKAYESGLVDHQKSG